jgi:hypothetical protein
VVGRQGADQLHPVLGLAGQQELSIHIALIDQMLARQQFVGGRIGVDRLD